MKKYINYFKKFDVISFLLILLILLICKNTNFFKSFYGVNKNDHNTRQQAAYDFCSYFATGYIFYVKKKFNLNKSPIIKNYINTPQQYWIFSESYKLLDESRLIILNKEKKHKININNYKVLNNFNDRCLLLKKND